jgi:alkylation response protein AidB-like acyl-CoA dehydrogenase
MFQLTAPQKELQLQARALARHAIAPGAAEVDRSEQYPWNNVEALTRAGFMGMTVPRELGGRGLSYFDAVLVIEEMAKVCGVTGRIVVEGNMGALGAILRYGSDEQRRLAARQVLSGDKPAICITEPEAGSAATEMATRAERRGDRWVLNGRKHWITGGGVSKLHLIFAQVVENGRAQGIGGFIAMLGDKGLAIGRREPAMGLRGIPETEVILENLEVPETMRLVPPEGIARGFAGLMNAYNAQRVGAGTVALGLAQGAFDLGLAFAKEREQFGRPICEFQGLQWMLADMAIGLDAARLMLWRAAAGGSGGFPDPVEAASAKILASETAIRVVNDALQLHGARGYSRNLPLERMARDVRMFTIGGGTAQILRTLVAAKILGRKLPQTRDGYVQAQGLRQSAD